MLIQNSKAETPVTSNFSALFCAASFITHSLSLFFIHFTTLFSVIFAYFLLMKSAISIDGMEVSMIENAMIKAERSTNTLFCSFIIPLA
jgi:hypothetical protein